MQLDTHFQIQWQWLLLPIGLDILGYLLLISMVYKSHRAGHQQLWKGSSLAAFYHRLSENYDSKPVDTSPNMEMAAKFAIVNLEKKEGRLMLVSSV